MKIFLDHSDVNRHEWLCGHLKASWTNRKMNYLEKIENTSKGMVNMDSNVVMNVTSAIRVVSRLYFKQRIVP